MSNTIIINKTTDNLSVIIDTEGPNLYSASGIINTLLDSYNSIESTVQSNSSAWFNYEEIDEVNTLQSLSSTWIETYEEMNSLQDNLSGSWQQTTDYIKKGIIDAGFF
jgi:hypothetical protein